MLRNTLYLRLLECVKKKDVTSTRNVHLCLLNYCQDSISTLGGYLIRALTTSTATLFEANLAFSSVSKPCVFTWNAIILAHTIFGEDFIALDLYTQMMGDGLQPNDATLSWVVKICGGVGALLEGMLLHQQVVENGSEMNVIVGNSLVDMYAKCGRLEEARNVFDKLPGKLWCPGVPCFLDMPSKVRDRLPLSFSRRCSYAIMMSSQMLLYILVF